MNQLEKLGIKIGSQPLVDMKKSDFDPNSVDFSKVVRKGNGFSPREALEQQLAKGGVGLPMTTITSLPVDVVSGERTKLPNTKEKKDYLKDTHGESHHSDNDKEAQDHQEEVEEIRLSLSPADLWSKAFLETDSTANYLDKSFPKPPPAKPSMVAPKTPKSPEQLKQEAAQKKELMGPEEKETEKCMKKGEEKLEKKAPIGVDPAKHERCVKEVKEQGHDVGSAHAICTSSMKKGEERPQGVKKKEFEKIKNLHENSDGVVEKKLRKSEIDQAFDWIEDFQKGEPQSFYVETAKPVQKQTASKGNFIKSMGPGGMIFDFGTRTGNPLADNATALLNQCSDRSQATIASAQRHDITKSLEDFVNMGERQFMMKQGNAQSNDLFDPHGRLNKGMDEQVKEAYARGEFNENGPTIETKFSKSQLRVGGEVATAMSETDAAVLEMMKGLVDAQGEGVELKQSITAGE